MTSNKSLQLLAVMARVAEVERQVEEVKGLVDRGLQAAQRAWFVVPALAAAWAFVVSDEDRLAVLESLADRVLASVPMDGLERWLAG